MPSVTNRSNRKKITALRSNLLHMLALCRAGTTPQIARALGLGRRNTLFHLQALQKAELVQSVARVRLTRLGRPQGAWALSHQGARTAGGFFAREQSSDSILKGVLRAEYFSRHPDGHYPLFFEDQVALFEAHGNP